MSADNKKPVWANREIRLDPYALPQEITYDRMKRELSGVSNDNPVNFKLNTKGAVMKCDLDCGVPLSMSLPKNAFQGVAARAFENEDGTTTVTLELLHRDRALSVPLCVADTVEDAASDWHSWSRTLGLPMLLVDAAGNATTVKDPSGIASLGPRPRRRRQAMIKHRPNFMRRRKVGMIGPVVRVKADEIIARN